jgi:hypothetical protein
MGKRWHAIALCMMLAAALSGCGGSSDSGSSGTDSGTDSGSVAAPAIATQPAALSVSAGQRASFTVSATGGGTLAYRWRKGGVALDGATSATYTIGATLAADAGSYDAVVSNSAGSVTSAVATLGVAAASSAPVIVTQPVSQSVAAGASVTLTATATGSGSLSYQWRRAGTAIAGASASSYTIASAAAGDAGSYDVVVTNASGTTASKALTLAVTTSTSVSSTLSTTVYDAAMLFYNSLSPSQQSTVQLAWTLDAARRWSNRPAAIAARNGVEWGNLSTAQQSAATALIKTALGDSGSSLQSGLQAADDYLAANGGGTTYGNGNYYIAYIGTPSPSGFWLLQITGHHLTWNIAFNGTYKSPTPLFLGIEPKGAFTRNGTRYDPMAAQRSAMANLGTALTGYAGAKLSGTYSDLLFGANAAGSIDASCPRTYASVTTHGLAYSALAASDQALAQAAIRAYVDTQAAEYANDLLGAYLGADALAQTYVAYAGSGTVTTAGNYFRIEGPRLWIEFSVQRGVIFSNDIHYHTIWRDKFADYGGKCIN